MTGFDETVPPDDTDADEDAAATGDPSAEEPTGNSMDEQHPEHDSKNPALEDAPDPDEIG